MAPVLLKDMKEIPLPSTSGSLPGAVTAKLHNGDIVGFSDLNITEACAVESKRKDSYYSAVKLPALSAMYHFRYNQLLSHDIVLMLRYLILIRS